MSNTSTTTALACGTGGTKTLKPPGTRLHQDLRTIAGVLSKTQTTVQS